MAEMALCKEYRIPLPFTVEEFRLGHRYMLCKSARKASEEGNDGVEIVEDRPFESAELGQGIYRRRVFHLGRRFRLPEWVKRRISTEVLRVDEETWDCYPYIRTIYTCPLLGNRFQIRAETYYRDDRGRTSAVHNKTLSPEERRHCKVDVINIGKEKLEPKYYQHNEDPSLYASEKTKRGPLKANWVYTTKPVMCAYKLLCVRFDYWGLKHKVEALTHQIFRTVYLQSHQQAFCWLDEWVDMTEEQIKQLEKETIEELNNKFQQQKHSASSTGVIHQKANL